MATAKGSKAKTDTKKVAIPRKGGGLKPFDGSEKDPIVFMFRPTHYQMVPNNKLKEWERVMAEKVGMRVTHEPGTVSTRLQWVVPGGGGATTSSSDGAGWDDSDYRG